jgi:protein-disulfide isomerase
MRFKGLKDLKDTLLNIATLVFTVVATVVVARRFLESKSPSKATPKQTLVSDWADYQQAGVRVGDDKAPVVIVEFFDFECPICRSAAPYMESLPKRFAGDVAVIYRNYPIHKHAFGAAVAAVCASQANAFQSFYDLLFDHPKWAGATPWPNVALSAGVADTTSFKHCMKAGRATGAVVRDTMAAHKLGAFGTPTFLVNGRRIDGFYGAETMDSVIAMALRNARDQKH